ncbi:hypothetical protein ACU4IU_00250 [Brevibacterium sp. CSND-B09]|uniref:hypothetical protein n=1 Tax=Brevibacterium sp. CSND-B09 TaxID=3462571 RepID=UPI00406A7C68
MNKITTAIISAAVGVAIGMTGIAGASAAPGLGSAKPKFTQSQMNKCAGAVLHADEFINGGERTVAAKKRFNKARNECAAVTGGF